ncbi:hypothetical protein [Niabella sp.]|uniref:hypothetical protein n=1 Tax=Niabella sp. TaxID=1962976 RepID=UPI002609CE29|nr:hypothetical protein [Niabella sp.]
MFDPCDFFSVLPQLTRGKNNTPNMAISKVELVVNFSEFLNGVCFKRKVPADGADGTQLIGIKKRMFLKNRVVLQAHNNFLLYP